ncbi:MAG: inosine monophosphate cyclohydrolase [Clostridiales bacterium]|nr:inosine monophosphate cyclohydrolase [Clostridiales bacterium]
MSNKTFEDKLINSTYPGRGIVIGMTPDMKNIVQVYWIMGRSVNSRNRIFEADGHFMRTKAFDESKLTDPSLIIYYPIKNYGQKHIVTNGNQTDTIFEYLRNSESFEVALETREYEPDPPNYTPRISGISNIEDMTYKLSILKTVDNKAELSQKNFFSYSRYIQGIGHCITTYADNGNPLPSFAGEPYKVALFNDIKETAEKFWGYLDVDNRVSLVVKFINCKIGKTNLKIINKNV